VKSRNKNIFAGSYHHIYSVYSNIGSVKMYPGYGMVEKAELERQKNIQKRAGSDPLNSGEP